MTSEKYIDAMRSEFIDRLTANQIQGDIAYFTSIFNRININTSNCPNDLADQQAKVTVALNAKDAAEDALEAANGVVYLKSVNLQNKKNAIATLNASIAALSGGPQSEASAVAAVRAFYGV